MDNQTTVRDIERKINLTKLMIEKRRERIVYYQKLINMGLTFSDQRRLDVVISDKEVEIRRLSEELDWLEAQKAFYE